MIWQLKRGPAGVSARHVAQHGACQELALHVLQVLINDMQRFGVRSSTYMSKQLIPQRVIGHA